MKLLSKLKVFTGLTPAIDRKSQRHESNVFASESKQEGANRTNFNFLTNGIKINKLQDVIRLASHVKPRFEIYEDRSLRVERRSQPNSLDGWNEIINLRLEVDKSCLIIKKSQIASYEEYYLGKQKLKEMYTNNRPAKTATVKKEQTVRQVKKVVKKIEKISIKEAMRDKEWISRAKSQIVKDLSLQIEWSNGLKIIPPTENFFTYKYYVGKGNNSRLVHQCLNSRWWWARVTKEEADKANFIWTQWKDKSILNDLESLVNIQHNLEMTSRPVSIRCNTKFIWMNPTTNIFHTRVVDAAPLGLDIITKSESYAHLAVISAASSSEIKLYNKLEHNYHLSNKKALFANLRQYYRALGDNPFDYIPLTYHITQGDHDPEFQKFEEHYKAISGKSTEDSNIWIVKPGENTNRGNGITVCSNLGQIKTIISTSSSNSAEKRTFIVQKYVENPFLVHKRKFDIRCYAMITSFNGVIQGYYYNEGYLRTSCRPYSIKDIEDPFIHLTNDAIQKYSEDYGKFESGNKMSYADFQRYLDNHPMENQKDFIADVLPKMKKIVRDTIQAVFLKLDPQKRSHTFEIYGYDFLLDSDLKPWLLEVNTNPCLELSSPHLARIIPSMLENSFRIALDTLFPEPLSNYRRSTSSVILEPLPENKYELVFHSCVDGVRLIDRLKSKNTFGDYCVIDPVIQEISQEIDVEEHNSDPELE